MCKSCHKETMQLKSVSWVWCSSGLCIGATIIQYKNLLMLSNNVGIIPKRQHTINASLICFGVPQGFVLVLQKYNDKSVKFRY